MTTVIARVATTHIIEQGPIRVRFTKEALESAAKSFKSGSIPINIEHDPYCLPVGKVIEGWVEPFGTEYVLMASIHIEDQYRSLRHEASGTELVCFDFNNAPLPFVRRHNDVQEGQAVLNFDLANFATIHEANAFKQDLAEIDRTIIAEDITRHALIPEPLVQFVISNLDLALALGLTVWVGKRVENFLRYTIDETSKKVADSISDDLSKKLIKILSAYKNRQAQDPRPILLKIVILGETDLILLNRISSIDEFENINLSNLTKAMKMYGDLLQSAQEATFVQTEDNEWHLQYLVTHSGAVIGTQECYDTTVARYQDLSNSTSASDEEEQ